MLQTKTVLFLSKTFTYVTSRLKHLRTGDLISKLLSESEEFSPLEMLIEVFGALCNNGVVSSILPAIGAA